MIDKVAVIACATLQQEVLAIIKNFNLDYKLIWLESKLHIWPDKLKDRIQEEINNLSGEYKTVLLVLGFCGNSLVGILSNDKTIVIPKVSDCFGIFLGSQSKRNEIGTGSYFFTEGYLKFENTSLNEYGHYKKKYSEEKANYLTKKMMQHYRQIVFIDTGTSYFDDTLKQIQDFADNLSLPVKIVDGDMKLLEDLLNKNWADEKFIILKPHQKILFEDSLCVGKPQF